MQRISMWMHACTQDDSSTTLRKLQMQKFL